MATIDREESSMQRTKLQVTDPEYTLSIIGLITAICGQPIVGLILSALALKQSHAGERQNTYALIGFIVSIVLVGIWVVIGLFYVIAILVGVGVGVFNRY